MTELSNANAPTFRLFIILSLYGRKKSGLIALKQFSILSGFLMKRDGFDTLIDHSPEKLQYVKNSLLQFANLHLGKTDTGAFIITLANNTAQHKY